MYLIIKRIIDVILSLSLLVLLFPLFVVLYLTLFILGINNPIYKQERSGKKGEVFVLYKYRTMDENGDVIPFCKVLRSTGLDEILQIINILKGDMSFVGPRPWIIEYERFFTKNQKRRLDVLPGLTGLAQISECKNIFDKIDKDLEYIDNISFKFDVYIIFKTIKLLILGRKKDLNNSDIKKEIYLLSNQSKKVLKK